MKDNKIDPFNKHLPISKVALADISSLEKNIEYNLEIGNIKTSISNNKIDIATFPLLVEDGGDNEKKIFAVIAMPVFPASEKEPSKIMVMAGKNTSRFFVVSFRESDKNYSFKDVSDFEPSEHQRSLIDSYIDELELSILDIAKKEKSIDYTYAEALKESVFEKNNIEFFKLDLFKFSPPASSLGDEKVALMDFEALSAKKNIDKISGPSI